MNVTTNTDLIKALGITPAVVLAVCQASPELTTREIAKLLGRDYSRTAAVVRDLKKRGFMQNAQPDPEIMQNAQCEVMQNAQHSAKCTTEIMQNAQPDPEIMQNAQKETEKERKQEKETFPPYNPLYKEKEIKKEKEKESDYDETRAHACEVAAAAVDVKTELTSINQQPVITHLNAAQSLEAVAQHAKLHPVALEQFCMSNYITADDFARLAEEIKTEWILTGVTSVNCYDARNHFYNTMRKKAAQLRQERAKTLGRTEKLTWSPDERLYLRPDCTEREREAYRQERERRARIEKENEKDLPF